jgi:hypothetical protein
VFEPQERVGQPTAGSGLPGQRSQAVRLSVICATELHACAQQLAQVDIDCVVVRGQLVMGIVSDNHPPVSGHPDCNTFVERGGRMPSALPPQRQVCAGAVGGGCLGIVARCSASGFDQGRVAVLQQTQIHPFSTMHHLLATSTFISLLTISSGPFPETNTRV